MKTTNHRNTFKDNLNYYMELNQLKQTDIARLINISKSSVCGWCSGKKIPRIEKIEELANLFGIKKTELLEEPIPKNVLPSEDVEFIRIPIVGKVAAGTTCFADTDIIDYDYIPNKHIANPEEYVFLEVKGDSMYPLILEGDNILVRCQNYVDSGSYAVVIVDDEDGVVKKIVYGKDFIELHSVNPMYPIRRFEGNDMQRIRIFGAVKKITRRF